MAELNQGHPASSSSGHGRVASQLGWWLVGWWLMDGMAHLCISCIMVEIEVITSGWFDFGTVESQVSLVRSSAT